MWNNNCWNILSLVGIVLLTKESGREIEANICGWVGVKKEVICFIVLKLYYLKTNPAPGATLLAFVTKAVAQQQRETAGM